MKATYVRQRGQHRISHEPEGVWPITAVRQAVAWQINGVGRSRFAVMVVQRRNFKRASSRVHAVNQKHWRGLLEPVNAGRLTAVYRYEASAGLHQR